MKYAYIIAILTLVSCNKSKNDKPNNQELNTAAITSRSDYSSFLASIENANEEVPFNIDSLEQRVSDKPTRITDAAKLAAYYDRSFDRTSNIDHLNKALSYRESNAVNTAIKPASAKRRLAQAYIKHHEFKKADSVLNSYTQEYRSKQDMLVQYDVAMELGNYDEAKQLLDSVRNERDFQYLIRAAKWNDYKGKLDVTIVMMEKALELALQSGDTSRKLWSHTNIADYYGHDGQIEKSYYHYRKALELDPNDSYSLKGISWIAYSNDNNTDEAINIITALAKKKNSPDYHLLLSELYNHNGNDLKASYHSDQFYKLASNPAYGEMYNLYLIDYYLNSDKAQPEKALTLAKKEVNNRATPETYASLAEAYLKNGSIDDARQIIDNHVIGKTEEPVAAYQIAQVLEKSGKNSELYNRIKEDLSGASYELGPVMMGEINSLQ